MCFSLVKTKGKKVQCSVRKRTRNANVHPGTNKSVIPDIGRYFNPGFSEEYFLFPGFPEEKKANPGILETYIPPFIVYCNKVATVITPSSLSSSLVIGHSLLTELQQV